ncbi:MAG: hypothetical protein IJS62_07380 [Bacteroidales bacterium]|nr:hypothetical protein [Bacteroidales bacterium]
MKRKILTFTAVLALLFAACGCEEKKPTPGPGPEPGPETEITTDNAAPAGFADEGPMSWDE